MELLLPLGQGAMQDCSVPLIPIFQTSLLCNGRVCAAVDTSRALHSCARKIRTVTHTGKATSTGAVTMVNYSARNSPERGKIKQKKNYMWNLLMRDTGGKSNWGKEIQTAKTRCKKKLKAAGLNHSSSSSRTWGNQWNSKVRPVSALGDWLLLQSSALCCTREFLG